MVDCSMVLVELVQQYLKLVKYGLVETFALCNNFAGYSANVLAKEPSRL